VAADGGNLFDAIPEELPEELVQALVSEPGLRIERIVSHGHASPPEFWYDQAEAEWVVLLRGRAGLRLADGTLRVLEPGDWIDLPAHARHRVEWTEPGVDTVWLAVFRPRSSGG